MGESDDKHRKRYVDHLNNRSKLTCLIHGTVNQPDKCKVLGYFSFKYPKTWHTKGYGQEPTKTRKFNRKKQNNDIVQHAVDEIILHDNMKLSVEQEAHDNIDSEVDENNLYKIDNMSIDEKERIT